MAKNEVDAFPCTEISKPEPGEDAFRRDGELLAKRSDRLQEDIGDLWAGLDPEARFLLGRARKCTCFVREGRCHGSVYGLRCRISSGSLLSRIGIHSLAYPRCCGYAGGSLYEDQGDAADEARNLAGSV